MSFSGKVLTEDQSCLLSAMAGCIHGKGDERNRNFVAKKGLVLS